LCPTPGDGPQRAAKAVIDAKGEKKYEGIVTRHSRSCRSRDGEPCTCRPSFQAWAFSRRDGRKIRRTFATVSAARAWRSDALGELRRGTLRAPIPTTVREAAEAWLAKARTGEIRTRSGAPFRPSTLRSYEAALTQRVLPEFGARKLCDVRRLDVQDFADHLLASGLDPSSVRNAVMPLRAIFRRAFARNEVAVNPTTGLELPAPPGRRDRIASPLEAAALVAALPKRDRALWATALYAGLRRGELQALRWADVDLGAGLIRVERAWDEKARLYVDPKSKAGRRAIPIASVLRDHLDEHLIVWGGESSLVFGRGELPFVTSSPWRRAHLAWHRVGLTPIGLHESRHTFASLMIAAGVNVKALSAYMGHSSITITLDRYGHLLPGNEAEAARLLDAYMQQAVALDSFS
jgi:integrase